MKPFIRVSDFPRTWSVLHGIQIGFNNFLHVLWIYVPRSNKFSSFLKIRVDELFMLTFFLCSYPEIPMVQTKEHIVVVDCLLWPYSRSGWDFGPGGAVGHLHWSFEVMLSQGRQALLGQPLRRGLLSFNALPVLWWLCASRGPPTPITPQAPWSYPLAQ